jgi:hypothetical protein
VIKKTVNSLVPASNFETQVRKAASKRLADMRDLDGIMHSYIACLSKSGDRLSQWRGYGRSRGFSIGFDRKKLQRLCPLVPEIGKPTYRVVNYSEAVQGGMCADIFGLAIHRFTPGGEPFTEPEAAAWVFILEALLLAPAFKSPAFEEEGEVRLQVFHDPKTGSDPKLMFRNGAMGLTPYRVIELRDPGEEQMTAIRKVIVGPQPNQDEALRAVRQLLIHNEMQDVVVTSSSISLRPGQG